MTLNSVHEMELRVACLRNTIGYLEAKFGYNDPFAKYLRGLYVSLIKEAIQVKRAYNSTK